MKKSQLTLLRAAGPQHGAIAPPGYYMLFILDATATHPNGVPSEARIVRVGT